MTGLEPDELRHRLFEAVEPLKVSPDAYERIRAGVIRRRRMRVPAMAFGGLALAGLIGVAYVVSEPRTSSTLVEPAAPLFTQTAGTATVRTPTSSSVQGGSAGGPARPPATQASSQPPSSVTETSPAPSPSATAGRPSVTPSNFNSAPLPTPVAVPAKKGDIDGDGVDDTPHLSGNTLTVTLSWVGPATVTLSEVASPLTFSITDIDTDGYGELIVQLGGNAGTRTFTVIKLTPARQLRQLSGPPLPLSAGLAGTHGDGFTCKPQTPGTLVVAAGDSTGDRTYSVTSTTWQLTGEGFQTVGAPTSSTVDLNTAESPFTAGCGIA
ncbi:VCBS repeat-containing protein [Candidatus Protofrankia californiensis]|uniref:VCBS repeat-containing protein n=1 Tax=Candidatus Protofrankia californiensis TaxID=1839754 RepID=UPI001040F7A4|nr:VCBS repeat-containing protein [Candidatus Protofrankia californiensis]